MMKLSERVLAPGSCQVWVLQEIKKLEEELDKLKVKPPEVTDGWIVWLGGPRPVAHNVRVDVRYRDNSKGYGKESGLQAGHYSWENLMLDLDIVAYKVIP